MESFTPPHSRSETSTTCAPLGVVFGLVHVVGSGVMLGFVPMVHPEIRAGRMEAPGVLAMRLGASTAMGFVMLHLVFGVVVAVLYAAWI